MSAKAMRLAFVAVLAAGCASSANYPRDHLAQRVCPPDVSIQDPYRGTSSNTEVAYDKGSSHGDSPENASQAIVPVAATVSEASDLSQPTAQVPPAPAPSTSPQSGPTGGEPGQVGQITLSEAIETAFRHQPRLRVYLESIDEAQGRADVAFAPYLP